MVTVILMREKEQVVLNYHGTVQDLLPQVGYSIETAVVLKNGTPVEESELVGDDDELKIIPVVSGG